MSVHFHDALLIEVHVQYLQQVRIIIKITINGSELYTISNQKANIGIGKKVCPMTSEQMRKLVGVQNNGSTWFMLATLAHSHTYLADMLSTQTGDNKYIHMHNVDIANRIYGNTQ